MEHILTRCREPPMRMIWTLTEQSWPREYLEWPRITLGLILGCGCINKSNNERREAGNRQKHWKQKGASRLATILISEAAHLIWVLCCERVIRERHHSDNEIGTRWKNTINTRLISNKIIATKIKCENKFTNL
jgi:hypothetical protein